MHRSLSEKQPRPGRIRGGAGGYGGPFRTIGGGRRLKTVMGTNAGPLASHSISSLVAEVLRRYGGGGNCRRTQKKPNPRKGHPLSSATDSRPGIASRQFGTSTELAP